MVKILYVVGALALIPPLVGVIEEARRGWDMHLTTIRNEHAYYCCVAQLMCDIPHPYPEISDGIFVCGDSHSLSTAWQILMVHGTPTPLIPKLVTGQQDYARLIAYCCLSQTALLLITWALLRAAPYVCRVV